MPEKHLYEYAVIRIVPKVEREEFINVGVILFSKQANFIKMRYAINENRLRVFSPELDIDNYCIGYSGAISLADSYEKFVYPDFPSACRFFC